MAVDVSTTRMSGIVCIDFHHLCAVALLIVLELPTENIVKSKNEEITYNLP